MQFETPADSDLPEVAAFINDCWRVAYAQLLDPEFLAGLQIADRAARLERNLARGAQLRVVRDSAGILGTVMYGPCVLPELTHAGQLNLVYVRPGATGQGVGAALLAYAEAELLSLSYPLFALDAFRANTDALRFYRAHGYAKTGEKVDRFEGRDYPLDIMTKAVEGRATRASSLAGASRANS